MTFAGASGQRFETVVLHLARFILDRSGLEDRLARLAQSAFDQFRHGFLVGPGFPLPVSLIKSVFFCSWWFVQNVIPVCRRWFNDDDDAVILKYGRPRVVMMMILRAYRDTLLDR